MRLKRQHPIRSIRYAGAMNQKNLNYEIETKHEQKPPRRTEQSYESKESQL